LDGLDELGAFILICCGIVFCFVKDFQNGLSLIGVGAGYLFGKNVPKVQK
jgi:hypothetical protein